MEKIKSILGKTKHYLSNKEAKSAIRGDIFIVIIMILLGLSSFGLGRLSALEKKGSDVQIEAPSKEDLDLEVKPAQTSNIPKVSAIKEAITNQTTQTNTDAVFASKTGKRYYFSWCTSQVKEENKVWFDTPALAEATGLTLAANCSKTQ
jgi:hypothetical protein